MIGCIRVAALYGPAVGTDAPRVRGAVGRRAGNQRRPVQAHANTSDRELIATSSSQGRPVRGRQRCGDPVESDGRGLRVSSGATAWITGAAGRRPRAGPPTRTTAVFIS